MLKKVHKINLKKSPCLLEIKYFQGLVKRFHSFYLFFTLIEQTFNNLFVEYHSCYPHCLRSVEGPLWSAEPRFELGPARTASGRATIWATPHPEECFFQTILFWFSGKLISYRKQLLSILPSFQQTRMSFNDISRNSLRGPGRIYWTYLVLGK
jgi:hypothetical protein